jgi:hypothetical protein
MDKLERSLGGIKDMEGAARRAVRHRRRPREDRDHEASKLGIPVVAVVDTNCSPDGVDYVIPGNDDAMRAIYRGRRAPSSPASRPQTASSGAMLEVNSETDFVAKNPDFNAFAEQALEARSWLTANMQDVDQLLCPARSTRTRTPRLTPRARNSMHEDRREHQPCAAFEQFMASQAKHRRWLHARHEASA